MQAHSVVIGLSGPCGAYQVHQAISVPAVVAQNAAMAASRLQLKARRAPTWKISAASPQSFTTAAIWSAGRQLREA
jgi:hypothetical protein